jgi:alanine racemase
MRVLSILRKIRKNFSTYRPAVEVFIYQENLLHNLHVYQQKYPQLLFAPVLKSNAYGHGLVQVAKILDKEKIAFLVVDSLFEAKILRNEGIKSPILVIGYTCVENVYSDKTAKIIFTITSLEQLKEISHSLKKEKEFHLKIDTGMHRQGILPDQIKEAIKIIQQNKKINLTGLCSHLADADNTDKNFTKLQITEWQRAVEIFKQNFANLKFFHLSATAGIAFADQIFANVARLGIGLYGINVSLENKMDLKPVLEMRSVISAVKKIKSGESVGYNATYVTKNEMNVATVPVGYFEGVDRRMAGLGFLQVQNILCPIIGKVSMNITTLDVTMVPGIKLNDSVSVISKIRQEKNSVENIAKEIGTIPYEILIHIPQHLRRIIK